MKNGKINKCSIPLRPVSGGSCTLQVIWQVMEDAGYQITPGNRGEKQILIRTCSGAGRVKLKNGSSIITRPGEAWELPMSMIQHYGTEKDYWHFYWFEYIYSGTEPGNGRMEKIDAPVRGWELPLFGQLQYLLSARSDAAAEIASELFSGFIHSLRLDAVIPGTEDRRITDAAGKIAAAAPDFPPLRELAEECGLSERRFRALFRVVTGSSPREYCEQIRMQLACHLLKEERRSVKETGDILKYSSQFAFSAAFKKYYGLPPREYLRLGAERTV